MRVGVRPRYKERGAGVEGFGFKRVLASFEHQESVGEPKGNQCYIVNSEPPIR